jgi:hypothetical protein
MKQSDNIESERTMKLQLISNPILLRIKTLLGLSIMAVSVVFANEVQAQQTVINFSSPTFEVTERSGSVLIAVTRSGDLSGTSSVNYRTDNDGGNSPDCSAFDGFASSRCDYNSTFGSLTFAPTEAEKTFRVMINNDSYLEPPFETFTVRLFRPSGAVVNQSTAIVKLDDINDGSPESQNNVIDNTTAFVRQQYRDFLNRDPDPEGLAFWVDSIDRCDDPDRKPSLLTAAQCKEAMRVNTSAAFFLSIEFRQTGGLVSSVYTAALDRPHSLPGKFEFLKDTQAVGSGVIVGVGDWESVLSHNRELFLNDFVTRGDFLSLYPTNDSPETYVNKLYVHALGRPASQLELIEGISDFGNAESAINGAARAKVLVRVISAPDFDVVNSQFVYMQYIGYLRREPNEQPDFDFSGFDFWLQKLDQFNGNFLKAEMVKAFVNSAEYRSRFGNP